MATKRKNVPNADQICKIEIATIRVADRLRVTDEAWVEALAASINERGLDTPITLRPGRQVKGGKWGVQEEGVFDLVLGAHRLEAAKRLGLEVVDCLIRDPATPAEARLLEIDENLYRHELNPLDRAVFLAERKAVYETLYPEAAKGGNRGNQHTGGVARQSEIISFSQATAEQIGMGERAIQRAVKIATSLSPKVRAKLAGTEIAKKEGELYNLAKHGPELQAAIVKKLQAKKDPAPTVAAALAQVEGHVAPAEKPLEQQQFEKLVDTWRRSNAAAKKSFISHLNEAGELVQEDEVKAEAA